MGEDLELGTYSRITERNVIISFTLCCIDLIVKCTECKCTPNKKSESLVFGTSAILLHMSENLPNFRLGIKMLFTVLFIISVVGRNVICFV